jgi:hypothetical protein
VTVTTNRRARPRLPFAVYILALLLAAKAGLLFAAAASGAPILNVLLADPETRAVIATPVGKSVIAAGAMVILVVVFAILIRRRAGWLVAMLITGVFVAFDILGFVAGTGNHLWMLLNIVTVFYLNQSDVREALGVTQPEPPPAADERPEGRAA